MLYPYALSLITLELRLTVPILAQKITLIFTKFSTFQVVLAIFQKTRFVLIFEYQTLLATSSFAHS